MSTRACLRGLIFAAFLAVQVAVPLAQLFEPRPARFGWQMFSDLRPRPRVTLMGHQGDRREVNPESYLGNPRAELDYIARLPGHICSISPETAAVEVVQKAPQSRQVDRCR